jgi:serine/threonine-protein kinase
VGSVVADRYHIEKKLGEGGMGTVYLGEHVKMGRKSAIKVMAKSLASDTEAVARFNREAANAARIAHPNVCAVYDFGETADGTIYLAMEYIRGESLNEVLAREGPLPPARATHILEQIGAALEAAHELGIVHRDLKPDNIMVTVGRDGTDVVKVVDFGIAKATRGEEGQKVTRTGLVVGTPEYMSPEQLSGDVLDGRSDIYSLGLVLYRMLTGILPFEADSAQEMMMKRLTDRPLPLAQAAPGAGFPAALQQALDRALERMPADRYGSVGELVREAAAALRQLPAGTGGVGSEAATELVDSAGLARTRISGSGGPTTPGTPAPIQGPAVRRRGRPVVALAAAIVVAGGGIALWVAGREPAAVGTEGAGNATPSAASEPQASEGAEPAPRQPLEVQETPDEGAPAVTTVVDSAAVDRELLDMIELIDAPGTRAAAMRRAEEIYETADVPRSLRAAAANTLGFGHELNGRNDLACDWYGRAIRLAPDNATYRDFFERMSCAA